jgi:DNA processing protein
MFFPKEIFGLAVQTIRKNSNEFPTLLFEIPDCPELLYTVGKNLFKEERCIAVIGTRNMTAYGSFVTEKFVSDLVTYYDACIVSGLALGIDGAAHAAALKARGKTIAVIASGLDCAGPQENIPILKNILNQGGMACSEYALGVPSEKFRFRQRNRIIAGMCEAVLVTEAGQRSGTFITAGCAAEYGRSVFAVPGPITNPQSEGTKYLVNIGATLVSSADDLAELLGWKKVFEKETDVLKRKIGVEKQLFELLCEFGMLDFQEFFSRSNLPISIFSQTITLMELHGTIRREFGRYRPA